MNFFFGYFLIASLYTTIALAKVDCDLKDIQIDGLKKTNKDIILKAINIDQGASLTDAEINRVTKEVKNLQIFSEVNVKKNSECELLIHVVEKWTTIPILKFGSGGGTQYYVVGVYDVNFYGTYKELGAQYENYQGNGSYVLWFRDPQFLSSRLKFGFDIWNIMREKLVYDTEGKRLGGYTLDRKKINSFFEYKQSQYFRYGFSIETNQDTLAQAELSDEVKTENLTNNIAVAQPKSNYVIGGVFFRLGEINYDNYVLDGWQATLTHSALVNKNTDNSYVRNHLELSYFKKMFVDDNLAFRYIQADQNNTDQSQLFDIGGLSEVRGYFDGQFRSNKFSILNAEYRKVIHEFNQYAILQAIAFHDRGVVASTTEIESTGVGIRLISPRIYRFNLRLDYAFSVKSKNKQSVNVGLQQFF